uniref:Uncharacterized protein n=1 Tax=Aegilops tauschii TaxID=37682 RepID=M8CKN3_AEGTA
MNRTHQAKNYSVQYLALAGAASTDHLSERSPRTLYWPSRLRLRASCSSSTDAGVEELARRCRAGADGAGCGEGVREMTHRRQPLEVEELFIKVGAEAPEAVGPRKKLGIQAFSGGVWRLRARALSRRTTWTTTRQADASSVLDCGLTHEWAFAN